MIYFHHRLTTFDPILVLPHQQFLEVEARLQVSLIRSVPGALLFNDSTALVSLMLRIEQLVQFGGKSSDILLFMLDIDVLGV